MPDAWAAHRLTRSRLQSWKTTSPVRVVRWNQLVATVCRRADRAAISAYSRRHAVSILHRDARSYQSPRRGCDRVWAVLVSTYQARAPKGSGIDYQGQSFGLDQRCKRYLEQATAMMESHRYDRAINYLTRALEGAPTAGYAADICRLRGNACVELGPQDKAAADYERANPVRP